MKVKYIFMIIISCSLLGCNNDIEWKKEQEITSPKTFSEWGNVGWGSGTPKAQFGARIK